MVNAVLSWDALMSCFSPPIGPVDAQEFVKSRFNTERLQQYLSESPATAGIVIPDDWYSTGWADKLERERYARVIAEKLGAMGVTINAHH